MSEPTTQISVSDLTCPICLDIAVDATRTACCGAVWCASCIDRIVNPQLLRCVCPHCRAPSPALFPDLFHERLAAATEQTCETCGFTATRDVFRAHIAAGHETLEEKVERLEQEKQEYRSALNCRVRDVERLSTENATLRSRVAALAEDAKVLASDAPRPLGFVPPRPAYRAAMKRHRSQ